LSALEAAQIPTLSSERDRLSLLRLPAVQFSQTVDFMVMMRLRPFLLQGLGIEARQSGLRVAS